MGNHQLWENIWFVLCRTSYSWDIVIICGFWVGFVGMVGLCVWWVSGQWIIVTSFQKIYGLYGQDLLTFTSLKWKSWRVDGQTDKVHFDLEKPTSAKSVDFLNIVQIAFDPPPFVWTFMLPFFGKTPVTTYVHLYCKKSLQNIPNLQHNLWTWVDLLPCLNNVKKLRFSLTYVGFP